MLARSLVTPFATMLAMTLATCVSAQPTGQEVQSAGGVDVHPQAGEDNYWCSRIPGKIGGPGYKPMWEGAEGPHSWTSGRNGNNILLYDDGKMKLHSGSSTYQGGNLYYIRINKLGEPDYYLHGYYVPYMRTCYIQVDKRIVRPNSAFYMMSAKLA